jgi:hypothetical protein
LLRGVDGCEKNGTRFGQVSAKDSTPEMSVRVEGLNTTEAGYWFNVMVSAPDSSFFVEPVVFDPAVFAAGQEGNTRQRVTKAFGLVLVPLVIALFVSLLVSGLMYIRSKRSVSYGERRRSYEQQERGSIEIENVAFLKGSSGRRSDGPRHGGARDIDEEEDTTPELRSI